jgi:hypothetical protein
VEERRKSTREEREGYKGTKRDKGKTDLGREMTNKMDKLKDWEIKTRGRTEGYKGTKRIKENEKKCKGLIFIYKRNATGFYTS